MCGIFAAFTLNNTPKFCESDFISATELVAHRGPNNIGHFYDNNCFLGHTRLAIVGLESASNQPFFFEDLILIFNGEIFNYIELREELIQLGYYFNTQSDTEVIIKSFHKWGRDCFSRFNGMWAIVIYNKNERTLITSRDRFGQKPLFVLRNEDTIFFSSEFQQLVKFSDKQIDYGLIQMFLKEGTYEGAGRTFYKSIEEFPKAHYFEIDRNKIGNSVRYWDYWAGDIQDADTSVFRKFQEILQDAIKIRLRADVPFGLLLSGGVDSTIIAAYSKKFENRQVSIPAYTYSSNDLEDESSFAKNVAEILNLSLTLRFQDDNPIDYKKRLSQLVKHMGRGHSSPAIISVDYLYESVSQSGIKVALDGQGADELLAGYKTYFPIVILDFILKGNFKQAFLFAKDLTRSGILITITLFLRNVMSPKAKRFGRWLYGYERFFRTVHEEKRTPIIKKHVSGLKNKNALNRYLIWHHNVGLENLLYYGDIVAMKNSVENRSPFMDHRLVDLVFSTSEKLKVWNGIDKYALRTLPIYENFRSLLDRKKIGFSSNIKHSTKMLMIKELRDSPILHWPILSKNLAKFINKVEPGFSKYERFLFRLYQVHLWNDIFCKSQKNDFATTFVSTFNKKTTFIDWVSTEAHLSFNKSLFTALGFTSSHLYAFSNELRMPGHNNIILKCEGRIKRAVQVVKICWAHRKDPIFFLTYDSALLPIVQLFCKRILVYEHNTTPENSGLSKHSIWQRLFYHRILRLAQYPSQMYVLSKLKQKNFYLGSPLRKSKTGVTKALPTVFLAPSWRLQVNELIKVKDKIGNREVIVKRGSLSKSELEFLKKELNITPLDWIDFKEYLPKTIAIIVTISSSTRGSGWFNEAIRYGIPLLITSHEVEQIVEKTFPDYPFISLDKIHSTSELDSKLEAIRNFTHNQYIDDYNRDLKKRFEEIIDGEFNKKSL